MFFRRGSMSGIYYDKNIDIAKRFIASNKARLSPAQVARLLEFMEEGETVISRNSVVEGGKNLFLRKSKQPVDNFNCNVIIETVGYSTACISPAGLVNFKYPASALKRKR